MKLSPLPSLAIWICSQISSWLWFFVRVLATVLDSPPGCNRKSRRLTNGIEILRKIIAVNHIKLPYSLWFWWSSFALSLGASSLRWKLADCSWSSGYFSLWRWEAVFGDKMLLIISTWITFPAVLSVTFMEFNYFYFYFTFFQIKRWTSMTKAYS